MEHKRDRKFAKRFVWVLKHIYFDTTPLWHDKLGAFKLSEMIIIHLFLQHKIEWEIEEGLETFPEMVKQFVFQCTLNFVFSSPKLIINGFHNHKINPES